MSKQEKEVEVEAVVPIDVSVFCAECGEDLEFKVTSDDDNKIDVEVEPHKCKEREIE